MQPAIGHREGRLGNNAGNRYSEFGGCYRLRRTAWQPAVGVRRVGEIRATPLTAVFQETA